ncbi:hypothetical protein DITRI_Ditri09bG0116300 [Diplodiscus trichospermus]
MFHGRSRLSRLWPSSITPSLNFPHRLLIKFKFSSLSQAQKLNSLDEQCDEFLPWLERKAGAKISPVLSIGKSAYGRNSYFDCGCRNALKYKFSGFCDMDDCTLIVLKLLVIVTVGGPLFQEDPLLVNELRPSTSLASFMKGIFSMSLFASEIIRTGDCILKVPYTVQIGPDNLLPRIKALIGDKIGTVAKLAIVLLVEQKMGQDSEWAPYIGCLPQHGEIHSAIFWSEYELEMIRQSSVYQETLNQKAKIKKDFAAIVPALEQFPEFFESITLKDFMRAYFLVTSRAWESTKGLSLIPFTDFMNHDGVSNSIVLFNEDKMWSEVIADRNYAPGEEVLISYGNFPNATLLLDFGFTLPHNIRDQVQMRLNIPRNDILREMKLELLQQHRMPTVKDATGFNCSEDTFIIKEVRSPRGKGKGLPQSLRAFARVLCSTSPKELSDLAAEAAQIDGRLARRPLKDSRRELQAHQMLLSHISHLMEKYDVAIKALDPVNFPSTCNIFSLRRQMAEDLLTGELRILKSASTWLKNYCADLKSTIRCQSER